MENKVLIAAALIISVACVVMFVFSGRSLTVSQPASITVPTEGVPSEWTVVQRDNYLISGNGVIAVGRKVA